MEISISDELNSIINYSRDEAMRTGSYGIAPDHLFLGIIRHAENTAADALRGLACDLQEMKQFIDSHIFTNEHIPYSDIENITFSRGAQNVLSFTILEATRIKSSQASSQHLYRMPSQSVLTLLPVLSVCRFYPCSISLMLSRLSSKTIHLISSIPAKENKCSVEYIIKHMFAFVNTLFYNF